MKPSGSEWLWERKKTADWLKNIPLRACSSAFRWPYADAGGWKEWAIRRSYNGAIMNVGYLAEICRALYWNTSLKCLVYNGIILFCFALEDGVVPSKPCAFFDQLSSTRLFGFPATSLGDPIVTRGKTFFVFDIVNVGCYLSSTRLRRCSVLCVQTYNGAPNSWRSHC